MTHFSDTSLRRLSTCHPDLQEVFNEVVKEFDCTILCGYRNKEEQEAAFDQGRSKVSWPDSKHNTQPSRAIDVAPYPVDWEDLERFYYFAGYVKGIAKGMGIKIRFGGDWDNDMRIKDNNFNDLVHFELI